MDQLVLERKSREEEEDLNIDHQPPVPAQLILWKRFRKFFLPGKICDELSPDRKIFVSRPHTAVNTSTGSRIITLDLGISKLFPTVIIPLYSQNHPKWQMKTIGTCCFLKKQVNGRCCAPSLST